MDLYRMGILLVDDSSSNTHLLGAILTNEGFINSYIATDRASTFELLERESIDLILISSVLQHYSGMTLSEEISSDLRYENIPIIMVTADNSVQSLQKSFESGAIDYISKPINSVELSARVQAHLIRKHIMDEKEKLAITDVLTTLYNRRYFDVVFDRQYNKTRKESIPLIFFMIDIDNFKKYNDNYGHQKGDEALKAVALAMKNTLRRKEDYLFRLGGEEFAILLQNTPDNYCKELSDSIHKTIATLDIEHNFNQNIGRISISIGICKALCSEKTSKYDIYNAADQALYKAKESGRNQSIFTALS